MDGTGITTIVQSNLGYPSGLALDIARQQLYWTDKTRHIIETATSQGHSRRTIITSNVTYPTAIAVFKDSIYWADSELKKIFQANNNGGNVKVIASSLTYLTDVKAFRQASQTGTNGCANNNGGCSHLCAPLPNNGHVCLCPDNAKTITSNGKMTCVCESGEVLQPGGFCSATNSSSCKSNQFTCNNHKCIPKSWHCDHDNDCGDNSDELGCSFQTCASWQFTCSDGRCISNFRKCDFIKDCRDGSDELNCVRPNCTSDEFRCNNKRCIRKSYVCDGDNDCYDNSDEKYCVSSHSCKSSEFRCKNGACIPKTFFCDKFNDCGDNSDEPKKCTPKPCTINQFVCNNGECIPNIWRCDGIADCGDSSDEKNCNTTTTTAAPTTQSSQCGSNQFKCKVTKFCIPLSYVCDGVVDCQGFFIPDSSDEANCPTTQPSGTSTPSSCGSNSFACLSGGCIPKASVCNHVTDCSDGSDELDCGFTAAPTKTTIMPTTPTNCSSQQFDCGAGSLPRCIPASFRCDNEQDCSNDADERHCQACSGFKCANGVCLKKNSQVCNGINECGDNSDEKHCASHQCSNSEFRCTSGQCIVKSGRCDGFNQCSDGSDEKSCDIVSSLVAAPFSAHSLRISWKYVQNSKYQVDHYRIYYRISGHNLDANYWPSYVDVPKFYHSKIISNLQPQTTYDATVTIITKSAAVLRKAPFVTTSTYASKPLPPKNLKAFVLAANKIKVTWEASSAPGVVIKNYKVAYRFGFLDTTITTRNSFVIISNLIPFTTYYVRVAAGTYDNVFSDYTNEYVVHTAPAVRITNGKYEFEGRVEVFHNNEWGTVCDGNWNIKAATVVCKQLGYYEAVQAVYFGQFGGSQGKIWLNNVHCSGSESSLLDCTHSGWSNTTCTHANDAGVVCSQAPVRLVGGLSSAEGRVEIKHNGFWGTICNFGWRIATSNVVCRSLGFPGAKPVNLVFGQTNNFGPGNGTVWLSNVRCQGNESFITECPYSGWGISSSACNSHRYDVGVSCLTKPVRLVTANQVNVYKQGTIEVSHKGKWGTICDHKWDQNDAVVICKQLGYTGAIRVAKMAEFGQGNGTVWLTDVQCKGNELNLHQCPSSGWGNNKCKHTHDAGVVCSYPMVRLVGGNQPNQGRLEINFNGVWGTVCDDRFDITDANVVCKQLGFIGAAAALGRAPFGQGNGPIWLDEVQCNGTEQSIGDCAHNNWNDHNCGHNEDVGIVCDTSEVRLVGGNSTREGRLEIIHNGRWGTICSNGFTKVDADVACRELGFSQADSVTSTSHFGSGTGPVWMQGVACKGSEKHLKECHFSGWGNSNCAHTNDVGIICSIPPVRLAGGSNGTNYAEGRVEIFHRQKWGTICDDYWDLNDANVICRQLKLPPASAAPKNAFFGAGTGPIWLDDVKCTGSETYINQCNTSAWQSHNCIHKEDAGVVCGMKPTMPLPTVKPIQCSSNQKVFTCKPNECIPMFGRCDGISQCSNGADEKNCLRLKTTTNNYTGMVEINHRGLWGTVCDDFWNLPDAIVLCRQLGFKGALQPLVMGQGGQGSANQPIWLDNVLCKGNETDIRNCQHSQFGVHNCDHTEDAGVICASGTAVPVTPTPSGPCHHWQFACDNNQKCIWFFDLCDNVTDCQDGSDEANCGGSTTVQPTGTTTTGQCGHGRFKCHNGQCINSTYVCNKRADCADGSDELNCGFSLGPTPSPGCSDTQFRCQFSKTCIPNEALCNGINDCTDGSDEHNCKHPLYFVSQLAAIKIASYQVTLGWTLTRTPQQYSFKVYSRQTHSGKSWKMEGQTSNFTYVVKNLSPFTQYSFTVSVIEPNRNGLKATPISIRTLAGKPGSPLNVKASSIHSSSIAVIWMAPKQSNGNILFYGVNKLITIFIHGGSIMSKVIKTSGLTNPNGPGLRYIIDNLRANTNYYIQVAAYSSTQGYGPKSPQIQVKTSVFEAPSRLNISMDPSTLKVVVTWKPAASSVKIQSYDLTVRANDPSSCVPIRYVIVDASVHTANIKHLIPGMEYIFSIAAVADGGQKYSGNSEIFVSKGVKPIPRDLSISATTNAIYLNWKEPVLAQGMKILNYYVHESVSENSGSKDYTTTKTTFSRPLTNTTYLYRVSANTNFGSGPCSKFLTYNYYPVPTAAPQSLTTILEISLPIAAVAVLVLIGACYYFNSSRRLRNRLQTFVGSHFRRDTDEATFLMSGDDDDDVLNDDGLSANDPTSDDDGLIRA
ncbi:uncharacterized protein TRIADDRAFT_62104 [Trichoplax adhaerens]|uniref:Sortilin-related receptor n=1 Tax=Trichoplax adhaerens TaxID=10228 RepID=B3SCU9_TRIAD|nr:hypothetical protein TRIADDRAFT_62104 [Trichoplax adhaerens]EDV19474.1 hypothetical protein TRIADDRAFT_62104 [Trichoplax adhaerens]|eukprot:XP_002118074.1 hypothetical protein TRIADDRAFT_62104 [Trichoplax adhaerens]